MTDTIAAIATAPGQGAIALLRLSGTEAIAIAEALFQGKKKPSLMESHRCYFGKIVHQSEVIDEVLLTLFRAPGSYTGEDLVEISCHGGVRISARILEVLLLSGARIARPGEFTQRAYLNGKMDLTQAEAVMDLIASQTERSQRSAMEQLSGRLGQEITLLRKELLAAMAHLEAFLDFPEEDIAPETGELLRSRIAKIGEHLQELLATAEEGRLLREGISVALCGAPNAGKSSLLNYLLGMERAIVSPIPGTTRDTLEESMVLGGFPFRFTDTAGLRATEDLIEQEGVLRAQRSAHASELCLHLVDAMLFKEPIVPIKEGELLVFNKMDLLLDCTVVKERHPTAILISCVTGEGIDLLISRIIEQVTNKNQVVIESISSSVAINKRHQACLQEALQATERALNIIDQKEALELLAVELHAALEKVGNVVGAVSTEEILGEIFQNFCIGK
ncbi:MAG: tRNA uridine-5-carboxymethylaminomethyl(34) synthesis GTPase MnmE [Chthoniobacterales bacterium]|nr:tRNA uridine-5-carboxymethylaminomethyl(34) synthesis GTPase MnmE [Chthoniobacterales bacterium]